MSRLRFFALCAVFCCVMAVGKSEVSIKPPETVTIDLTTSTASPTTLMPETTTTEKTTTAEPTTTEAPTTEAPTTTPAPEPTPKPTPAPTPVPPKPVPPPDQGLWHVTNTTNNVTCIVIQFAAQFNVTYNKLVNDSPVLVPQLINVPANASGSGNCSSANGTQTLTLSWTAADTATANNFTLTFLRNDTTHNYALRDINVELSYELFDSPASNKSVVLTYGSGWTTPLSTSYRCAAPTRLNMSANPDTAALTLTHLQEEAFRTTKDMGFSAARECGGGDVPDAVPIAVGCALGGLVVVVLIAYLVARRRSAARGYLSM